MREHGFTVLRGGVDLPPEIDKRTFCTAHVTDTRLMGVLGLSIHWEIEKNGIASDFYQFFYLDAEEFAIESYTGVYGNDPDEIQRTENALIGGLGGEQRELNERECRLLLMEFASLNDRYKQPLPEPYEEYAFLLEPQKAPDAREYNLLMEKLCTPLVNDYQRVHYFLMRIFGKDLAAAQFLATNDVNLNLCQDLPPATLCKNTVDPDPGTEGSAQANGVRSYIAESLLDLDSAYRMVISRLEIDRNNRICAFERINAFRVTSAEAAMQLAKPEFVTVYTLLFDPSEFEARCGSLIATAMHSTYENGRMFMLFNKNNDHVKNRIFLLSEDVRGLLYVSEAGQLLAVSYSLPGIHRLESGIRRSPIAGLAFPTAKYEFKEPILYDFIQSDFDDFNDFLNFIREDE